ncbi:MAG TPA: 30S ribosomal protein S12 methylthiotransferase RimO [Deltaproteobacteria bacterium]|nr:MAG: ribosomal protein S12 methylthiotransferase RimO [Deltaproteobacteria bacterium GWA2_55_82]OIJ73959.1 MAG: ribosomal protein S12 methylthiotransferase RimO [Deltaproteobacteria bacterium GWC2_55_46]HBG46557.1 30S ribosomal protein S12 methylthiotransferase RimO [Deltaproteobacteria bacterium]HCY09959.1 30S ribosomal protein S12 methylthiotransferase RimO [Deltaproteobacteria bacterium]
MRKTAEKVCLISLGCPKNLVDSEVMLGILKGSGMELTSAEGDADVLIVNTCGFIGDAKEESIDEILALAEHKKTGRCRRLIVTGCLSQRYKEELAESLPEVDCFIGTGEYHRIAEAVQEGFRERVLVGLPTFIHDYTTPRIISTPGYYAYVKVAEGCSNHCSYCSIPSIRGSFRSRSVESVVREAEALSAQGIKEINLIAQDTTSFGKDRGEGLEALLKGLVPVKGIEWIRLLYLYPGRITDELISIMKGEEKVLSYIDLPLQHISPPVLKAMNRLYDRAGVEALIEKIRSRLPDAVLRTSMITGFPGETEKDFEELLGFVEAARFDRLGAFVYSREEGTPAYSMKGQVPKKVKAGRMEALMAAQREISLEKNSALVGKKLLVLVEGPGEEGYAFKGRASAQAPDVDGAVYLKGEKASPGDIVSATVTGAGDYDIYAEADQGTSGKF